MTMQIDQNPILKKIVVLKFFYAEKQCSRQFWNTVECEPVETRVLNPTASEASQLRSNVATEKRSKFFF